MAARAARPGPEVVEERTDPRGVFDALPLRGLADPAVQLVAPTEPDRRLRPGPHLERPESEPVGAARLPLDEVLVDLPCPLGRRVDVARRLEPGLHSQIRIADRAVPRDQAESGRA